MAFVFTKKLRVAAVCTVVWLIVVFVVALNTSQQGYDFQRISFASDILVFGIIPCLLLWGIIWISAAPKKQNDADVGIMPALPRSSAKATNANYDNGAPWPNQNNNRGKEPFVTLANGKRRYIRATLFDIVISILIPLWGVIVGLYALSKNEVKRGITMFILGLVAAIIWTAVRYHPN